MTPERKGLRCAIYTRKSSEEGLEQSFNSLDAQREACEAYVGSQRHEGWKLLEARYDDGGFSGGSMERPGLKSLLADIEAEKVDVVVVYKVDRLTRSLADFAKMVELFDRQKVSFVSVTQQFNTTTSMGRLTLNVLLSFAQFEREVTGERIRDKIAASKRKGMWMGGYVPLGYDLFDRKLKPNAAEARLVTRIFERYLALGCVKKLQAELKAKGIVSKVRIGKSGRKRGGAPYSRGALYAILQNRLYLGQIAHRGSIHAGDHEALVKPAQFEAVQERLKANGQARRLGVNANTPSLLAGLLYDAAGHRLTPLHTTTRGKRYRYYTSQGVIQNGPAGRDLSARLPAHGLEATVCSTLSGFLARPKELLRELRMDNANAKAQAVVLKGAKTLVKTLRDATLTVRRELLVRCISRITVHPDKLEIRASAPRLLAALYNAEGVRAPESDPAQQDAAPILLTAPFSIRRARGEVRLIVPAPESEVPAKPDLALIRALARAHTWREMRSRPDVSFQAIMEKNGVNECYMRRIMPLAYLSPAIVEQILDGRQPPDLTLARLVKGFPISWAEQQNVLLNH